MMKRTSYVVALLCVGAMTSPAALAQDAKAKALYEKTCAGCHETGVGGAPKLGDAANWGPRIKTGIATLYNSALKGKPPIMPPKGGASSASDADIKAVVDYMVGSVKGGAAAPAAAAKPAPVAAPAAPAAAKPAPAPAAVAAAPAPAPAAPAAAAPAAAPSAGGPSVAAVNTFNRLLRPINQRTVQAALSGIHDPTNDGTLALQSPADAYATLPRTGAGNTVNWVKALSDKLISPRWDRVDANAAPVLMDLNIVREVKGSMPDVVYPHLQHTEWLDCSNCHPAIFIPQKGANQISMASILLGQQCGVCHGKVAFPVSECRLCHSKKKDAPIARTKQ